MYKRQVLASAARRDFGEADVSQVLKAWKLLSRAWERIPISHILFGERNGYMKGPFWLGPAHPLIFDVQRDYGLSRKFARCDPGQPFAVKPTASLSPHAHAPHAFCSDLLFTYPFTPATVEETLCRAVSTWNLGLHLLEQAMGPKPVSRATMELDVGRTLSAILRSAWNVVRFYRARETLFGSKGDLPSLHRQILKLQRIIDDEVVNARRLIPILERDPRLGNNPLYGTAFDTAMIQEKIRQCLYVRNSELPFLIRYLMRFNFLENDLPKKFLIEERNENG